MTGYVQVACSYCGALLILMAAQLPFEKFELTVKPDRQVCVVGGQSDRSCFAPLTEAEGGIDLVKSFEQFGRAYNESNRLRQRGTVFSGPEVRAMAAGIAVLPNQRLDTLKTYSKLVVDEISVDPKQFSDAQSSDKAKSYAFVARVTLTLRNGALKDRIVFLRGHVDVDPDFESKLQGLDPENAKVLNELAKRAFHIDAASDNSLNAFDARDIVGPAVLAHLYFATKLADAN